MIAFHFASFLLLHTKSLGFRTPMVGTSELLATTPSHCISLGIGQASRAKHALNHDIKGWTWGAPKCQGFLWPTKTKCWERIHTLQTSVSNFYLVLQDVLSTFPISEGRCLGSSLDLQPNTLWRFLARNKVLQSVSIVLSRCSSGVSHLRSKLLEP